MMYLVLTCKQNKAEEVRPMFYRWSLLVYTGELVYRIALHTCIHIAAVGNWNHGSSINYNSEILYKFQSIHTNVASTRSYSWTVLMLNSWPNYAWTRIPTCSLSHQMTVFMTNKIDNNAGLLIRQTFYHSRIPWATSLQNIKVIDNFFKV